MTKLGSIVENIGTLVTMQGSYSKKGKDLTFSDLSIVSSACLIVQKGKVVWMGPQKDRPLKFKGLKKLDARGGVVIPAFVDSHTHAVFAGDRSVDFEKRLSGESYSQIAAAGGGILTTMKATRAVSAKELYDLAVSRLNLALQQGVGSMEIKTGYGLDFESEKKCLDVIAKLKKNSPITIKSTFLAAHALPPEFKGRKSDYIKTVAFEWLPKLKNKIDFVDIFLDEGYFDVEDANILLAEATKLGLASKIHADELALTGGTQTAVKCKSLSADHLLKITAPEIKMLSQSDVTATLLPTTAFFLNAEYAPARALLDGGARVALATDFNPGTSPTQDISLTALLSALKMKMEPFEILAALTINGAFALGLEKRKGVLAPGYDADFVILNSTSLASFFYEFGFRKLDRQVFIRGQKVIVKKS